MAPVLALALSAAFAAILPDAISNGTLSAVRSNMIKISKASWELGTAAQALTEISWPELSVYSRTAFPPPARLNGKDFPVDVINIASDIVSNKPASSLALIPNQGSSADPASLGVAVLLANWTRSDRSDRSYADAATGQLQYLLEETPRTQSGAISHRASEAQLWSDYMSMVPPFIAAYGALQGGKQGRTTLQIAYDQCRLYREEMSDDTGLWDHILLGSYQDRTHWATGNAWAAAGMMRVVATMNNSYAGKHFTEQQANLTSWINEILETSWSYQTRNGALRNVIDDPTTFEDTASTALMAAITYRYAVFAKDLSLVSHAHKAYSYIRTKIDRNGWLLNAVNPNTFHTQLASDEHSPEGQAFVLNMHAALLDYVKYGESIYEAALKTAH